MKSPLLYKNRLIFQIEHHVWNWKTESTDLVSDTYNQLNEGEVHSNDELYIKLDHEVCELIL